MAAISNLAICNMALAEVPHSSISSMDEKSQAANECSRVYAQCVWEMLAQHQFTFATRLQTLAVTTNDRPRQWQAAFALPDDYLRRIDVRPDLSVTPSYPHVHRSPTHPYIVADRTLYANWPGVVLEYTSAAITPADFPPLFVHALALAIAARVVMPLLKSRERQGDLIKAAQTAWERAVAEEMNQAPTRTLDFMPHDARARQEYW